MKFFDWLKDRATEPSTYAGLAVLATVAGHAAVAEQVNSVGHAIGLIFGTGLAVASTAPKR